MNQHRLFSLFSNEGPRGAASSSSHKTLGEGALEDEDERQPLDLTSEENMQDIDDDEGKDVMITQHDDEGSDTLRIDDGEDDERIQLVNGDEEENVKPIEYDEDIGKAFEIYEKNYRSHEIKNSHTAIDAMFYEIMEQNFYPSENSHIILSKRYEKICERK